MEPASIEETIPFAISGSLCHIRDRVGEVEVGVRLLILAYVVMGTAARPFLGFEGED
jgi:hypothetical protein